MQQIPKVQTDNREVNQLQENILSVLNPLLKNPILSGRIVKSVPLSSSRINTVNHGLDRQLIGWFIVNADASASVYSTGSNTSTLTLRTNNSVNVSIYVF